MPQCPCRRPVAVAPSAMTATIAILASRSALPALFAVLASAVLALSFSTSARAQNPEPTPEYRAQWVDYIHDGYKTPAQVTTMVQDLRTANCNVVVPEIRANSDAWYVPNPGYYTSLGAQATIYTNGVPIVLDLDSEPEPRKYSAFDPLGEVVRQAHTSTEPLEVWAWLVAFRSGAAMRASHPEWLTRNVDPASVQADFDPGHPGVEQQLVNVCRDIVSSYDVDGLNFDYIRFTDAANGYNPVSVARFNATYGRTGTPSNTDALWRQWRRDQVTAVLRKIYLTVISTRPELRISADTITWTPAPNRPLAGDPNPLATWKAGFEASTAAYKSVYQDWRSWMQEGILDIAIPMSYFRECTHASAFDAWSDFAKDNQFNRQAMIGPGVYLNTLDDNYAQLKRTRLPSSSMGRYGAGQSLYSYASPYASTCGGSIVNDPSGMAEALSGGTGSDPAALYPTPVLLPSLPRLVNGKGHLKGTVTRAGSPAPGWVDGATVTASGPVTRTTRTDGTGFYGFVDLPPGAYAVTVRAAGVQNEAAGASIVAGSVATRDFVMPPLPTPARVGFAVEPAGATAGEPLSRQPVVAVQDSAGRTVANFSGPVTLSLKAGTGAPGAHLMGATTVLAVNGIATFTDLAVDAPGSGYALVAESGELDAGESAPFNVLAPPHGLAEAARALALAAGLGASAPEDMARLDIAAPAGALDLADAILIARKAASVEANP